MTNATKSNEATFKTHVSISDLAKAKVYCAHKVGNNPKMKQYMTVARDGTNVINLVETRNALMNALYMIYQVSKNHGRILFVCSRPNAAKYVKQYATECGQYYFNYKWFSGVLTNFSTLLSRLKTFDEIETTVKNDGDSYTKKEMVYATKELIKLERDLGGVRGLVKKPDLIVVLDGHHNKSAILEAKKAGIKVIAITDTNADPDIPDLAIPGNDDSVHAIQFYLKLASEAVLLGIKEGFAS